MQKSKLKMQNCGTRLTADGVENAKIKVKNAKLWNPDGVGMAILIIRCSSLVFRKLRPTASATWLVG